MKVQRIEIDGSGVHGIQRSAVGRDLPGIRVPPLAQNPPAHRRRRGDPPQRLGAGPGAGQLDPPAPQGPRAEVGVGVHEAGGNPGVRQVVDRRAGRDQARHGGGGPCGADPAGVPPDRVAGHARSDRHNARSPEEAAPALAQLPEMGHIHMWKSRQSEYPKGRLEFENG